MLGIAQNSNFPLDFKQRHHSGPCAKAILGSFKSCCSTTNNWIYFGSGLSNRAAELAGEPDMCIFGITFMVKSLRPPSSQHMISLLAWLWLEVLPIRI